MVVSFSGCYSFDYLHEVPVKTRKNYTRKQLDRMSHTERKNVFDHITNTHKVLLKRAKLRKKRKK